MDPANPNDIIFQTPPTTPESLEYQSGVVDQPVKNKPATDSKPMDFDGYYKPQIQALLTDWKDEVKRVEVRRKARTNRINVKDQQTAGTILTDETIIGDRTIDTNVRSEKAAYMVFVETSRRVLIVKPPPGTEVPAPVIEAIETEFTNGTRYTRWKSPWYKIFDGAVLHGCNFLEVVYDESKPLKSRIDFLAREKFIYPVGMEDVQNCEMVLRQYTLAPITLDAWKANPALGFKTDILTELLKGYEKEKRNKLIPVYKVFFKRDGVVHYAWYSDEVSKNWMRDPVPLDIGLKQVKAGPPTVDPLTGQPVQGPPTMEPAPVLIFPFFPLKYQELEDEQVIEIQGRASIDLPTQDAATSLMSSIVNGAKRASGFYPYRKPSGLDVGGQGSPIALEHGKLISGDVGVFQPNWPNISVLSVIQALSVRNLQQIGKTDFAAMQRNDTAKTAAEIEASKEQASVLSSMQTMLLSDCVLSTESLRFEIWRSQVFVGQVKSSVPNEILALPYTLAPAGDIEVVKRAERKAELKEAWPVISQTPAAMKFFEIMIEALFPEEAATILSSLQAPDTQKLITELANALKLLLPDVTNPAEKRDLENLISIAQNVAGAGGNGAPAPAAQGAAPSQPGPGAGTGQ